MVRQSKIFLGRGLNKTSIVGVTPPPLFISHPNKFYFNNNNNNDDDYINNERQW